MVPRTGNSEIGAHVRSNLCYWICLRHWIRLRAATNRVFFLTVLFTFMRAQHGLSYHLIQVPWERRENTEQHMQL